MLRKFLEMLSIIYVSRNITIITEYTTLLVYWNLCLSEKSFPSKGMGIISLSLLMNALAAGPQSVCTTNLKKEILRKHLQVRIFSKKYFINLIRVVRFGNSQIGN